MIGVRNNGVQQSVELVFDALDVFIGFRIVLDLLGCREQLHCERTVRCDRQLADVCELRAGLAVENGIAFLVFNNRIDDGVAVTVDECIRAGDVLDDFGSRPGLRLLVDTHVTDEDDVIRAFFFRSVNRSLCRCVDAFTGRILAEAVDVRGVVFVHEVGGGGLGDGFRRGETDKRDLLAVRFKDLVSVEHRLVAFDLHKVRGNVRIFGLLNKSKHLIHTVVELMVAERCEIVTDKVHDVDDRFALGEGADRSALDVVARVNEDDFIALCFEGLLEVCKACVTPAVADAAVYVVREQNDRDGFLFYDRLFRRLCIELHFIETGLAAVEAVNGEVAAVILHVLRLFRTVASDIDRSIALDIEAVRRRFQLEQRVCRVVIRAFYELRVVVVHVQILAVCCLEGVLIGAFASDVQLGHFRIARNVGNFNGQADSFSGNGQNAVGQRCFRCDKLVLFSRTGGVFIIILFIGHDHFVRRIIDDDFVTVCKRLN